MTVVSARQYLANQDSLQTTTFAPMPGYDGPAVPVARGWALAITTTDPLRQRAAAELISWLLAPEREGAWAQAASWLPVSPLAQPAWGTTPYHEFLHKQLAVAVNSPADSTYAQTASQLRKAVVAVLKDHTNPTQAAQAVTSQTPAK